MKHLGSAKSGPKDCDDLLGGLGVGWGGVGWGWTGGLTVERNFH